MTTIILVIVGILAVGLAVFSWRFENCRRGGYAADRKRSAGRYRTKGIRKIMFCWRYSYMV